MAEDLEDGTTNQGKEKIMKVRHSNMSSIILSNIPAMTAKGDSGAMVWIEVTWGYFWKHPRTFCN